MGTFAGSGSERKLVNGGPRKGPGGGKGDTFSPDGGFVEIRYTNHRGEEKAFRADGTSIGARGRFVSARLAPAGRRAAPSTTKSP